MSRECRAESGWGWKQIVPDEVVMRVGEIAVGVRRSAAQQNFVVARGPN